MNIKQKVENEIRKNRNAVRSAIESKCFPNSRKLTTYLMDTFVHRNGKIKKDHLVEKGLCGNQAGTFKTWRDLMVKADLITFEHVHDKYVRYYPGKKLIDYVNKEKNLTQEMATKNEVREVESELLSLRDKVNSLEKGLDQVINMIDPPSDSDKRQKFMQGQYKKHLTVLKSDDHG